MHTIDEFVGYPGAAAGVATADVEDTAAASDSLRLWRGLGDTQMLPTMTTWPVEPDGGGGPCWALLRRCVDGSSGSLVHQEATPRTADPTMSLNASHASHERMSDRRQVSVRASGVASMGLSALEASSGGSVRMA